MKKILIRVLIVGAVLLILGVIAVGLFLDGAIKKGVETFGPQFTRVSIRLDSVKVSMLSGSGSVKGLLVGNPDGFKTAQAISVGTASLGLRPGSLLSDKIVIKHIQVDAPEITFEGGLTENNLSKILDNVTAAAGGTDDKSTEPKAAGPRKKLQVDDFLIKGAKMNLSLTGMGGNVIPVPLPDIHLSNLGAGPDGITAAELTKLVFKEILAAATKAASSDAVKILNKEATDAMKDVGGKATETLKGATELFKKKK